MHVTSFQELTRQASYIYLDEMDDAMLADKRSHLECLHCRCFLADIRINTFQAYSCKCQSTYPEACTHQYLTRNKIEVQSLLFTDLVRYSLFRSKLQFNSLGFSKSNYSNFNHAYFLEKKYEHQPIQYEININILLKKYYHYSKI